MLPQGLATFGWREWVGLNDLNLPMIKAKVDTGARTSAPHAIELEPVLENGVKHIRFRVQAPQKIMTLSLSVLQILLINEL